MCVSIVDFRAWRVLRFGFFFSFLKTMGTEFSVTAVESGTRALQFLGLDGEENSVGFDVRRMSLEIRLDPCLVAKKKKKKVLKSWFKRAEFNFYHFPTFFPANKQRSFCFFFFD